VIEIKMEGIPALKKALENATGELLAAAHNANILTAFDIDRDAKKLAPWDTGRLRASIHPEIGDNHAHGVTWKKPFFDAPQNFQDTDLKGETYDGSLNVEIPGGGAVVGTNVDYAAFQEFGFTAVRGAVIRGTKTKHRRQVPPRPYLTPAAKMNQGRYVARMQRAIRDAIK